MNPLLESAKEALKILEDRPIEVRYPDARDKAADILRAAIHREENPTLEGFLKIEYR